MHLLKIVVFLSVIFSSTLCAVEIAFLKQFDAAGNPIVLVENEAYSHVAIKVQNKWLHAIPYYGVILSDSLERFGEVSFILSNESIEEPDSAFLESVLGKKYFLFSDWNNFDEFNCTKLIGVFLDLEPKPLIIQESIWGHRFDQYKDRLGLSIGELQLQLNERGYLQIENDSHLSNTDREEGHSCRKLLL